jgi:intracellular septation protein
MGVFFAAFQAFRQTDPDRALFLAAGVFALAALAALAFGLWHEKRISKVLLASTLVIVGTAALAALFDNKLFLFMRPTVLNGGLGLAALAVGVARPAFAARLLERRVSLPRAVWVRLAIRCGVFFLAVALINEAVWRTQGEAVWIAVKTFGFAPATLVFSLAHLPLVRRHAVQASVLVPVPIPDRVKPSVNPVPRLGWTKRSLWRKAPFSG